MICLILLMALSAALATPHGSPLAFGLVAPIYNQQYDAAKGAVSYTATNVDTANGAIKQQTAVGKDIHGGHSIRHSAQATHTDPHSGQTAVKHEEQEFHINPYFGQATVHTNNAEGSLNPSLGHAAFQQKTHDAQIAPGLTSVADSANTAAVSPHSNAASQDVHSASAEVVHDGIAHNSHTGHRSYSNAAGVGGVSRKSSTTSKGFDGQGYGNLQYNTQHANQAYDPYGHASVDEAGYDLNQAYDVRVGLGASNELEYSRRAAHDPYGNYGAVTESKQTARGGQLVPSYSTVYHQPAPVAYEAPVAYNAPVVYDAPVYAPAKTVSYNTGAYVPTKGVAYDTGAYVPTHAVAYDTGAYVPTKNVAYAPSGYYYV